MKSLLGLFFALLSTSVLANAPIVPIPAAGAPLSPLVTCTIADSTDVASALYVEAGAGGLGTIVARLNVERFPEFRAMPFLQWRGAAVVVTTTEVAVKAEIITTNGVVVLDTKLPRNRVTNVVVDRSEARCSVKSIFKVGELSLVEGYF